MAATFDDPQALEKLAELAVGFGANVHPGQIVAIGAEEGKEQLARALAIAAYKAGAKFVDVTYFDMHVKKARIEFAPVYRGDFRSQAVESPGPSSGAGARVDAF